MNPDQMLFIKPLGVIVSASDVESNIALYTEERSTYELVRDEHITSSPSLRMRRSVELITSVDLSIRAGALALSELGVEEFNAAVAAEIEAEAEEAFGDTENEVVAATPAAPRRRGRRSKADIEAEAAAANNTPVATNRNEIQKENYLANRFRNAYFAHTFDLERVRIVSEEEIPLVNSEVANFRINFALENKGEDAANTVEEIITTKAGQLVRLVAAYQELIARSANDLSGAVVPESVLQQYTSDDLEDVQVRRIDQQGLDNYRNNARAKIDEIANNIREIYSWFDRNVINVFNERASGGRALFTDEIVQIGEHTILQKHVAQMVFTDILASSTSFRSANSRP